MKALVPKVPPAPIFRVEASVPDKPSVLLTVSVLDVVPPATENPVVRLVRVNPLTEVGVMAPKPMVRAGVEVAVAQVAVTPLLAAAVETEVTVPVPVPTPIAVLKLAASSAVTELSALNRGKVIAPGFVRVNRLDPTVVAPKEVLPVAAVRPVDPPSH